MGVDRLYTELRKTGIKAAYIERVSELGENRGEAESGGYKSLNAQQRHLEETLQKPAPSLSNSFSCLCVHFKIGSECGIYQKLGIQDILQFCNEDE